MELDNAIFLGTLAAGGVAIAKNSIPSNLSPFSAEGLRALGGRITQGVIRRKNLIAAKTTGQELSFSKKEVQAEIRRMGSSLRSGINKQISSQIGGAEQLVKLGAISREQADEMIAGIRSRGRSHYRQQFGQVLDWLHESGIQNTARNIGTTTVGSFSSGVSMTGKVKELIESSVSDPYYGRRAMEYMRSVSPDFIPSLNDSFLAEAIGGREIGYLDYQQFRKEYVKTKLAGSLRNTPRFFHEQNQLSGRSRTVYNILDELYGGNLNNIADTMMHGSTDANNKIAIQAKKFVERAGGDLKVLFNAAHAGPSGIKMRLNMAEAGSLDIVVPFFNPKTGSMMIGGQEFVTPLVSNDSFAHSAQVRFNSLQQAMLDLLDKKILEPGKGGYQFRSGLGSKQIEQIKEIYGDLPRYIEQKIVKEMFGNDFWAARQAGFKGFAGQPLGRGPGAALSRRRGVYLGDILPRELAQSLGLVGETAAQDIDFITEAINQVNPSYNMLAVESGIAKKGLFYLPESLIDAESGVRAALGPAPVLEEMFPGGVASWRSQYYRESERVIPKGKVKLENLTGTGSTSLLNKIAGEGGMLVSPRTLTVPEEVAQLAARNIGLTGLDLFGEEAFASPRFLEQFKGQAQRNLGLSVGSNTSASPLGEALMQDFKDYVLQGKLSEESKKLYDVTKVKDLDTASFYRFIETEPGREVLNEMLQAPTEKFQMLRVQEVLDRGGVLGQDAKNATMVMGHDLANKVSGERLTLTGAGVYAEGKTPYLGISLTHEYNISKAFTRTGEKGILNPLEHKWLQSLAQESNLYLQFLNEKGVNLEAIDSTTGKLQPLVTEALEGEYQAWKKANAGKVRGIFNAFEPIDVINFEAGKHPSSRALSGSVATMAENLASIGASLPEGEMRTRIYDTLTKHGFGARAINQSDELYGKLLLDEDAITLSDQMATFFGKPKSGGIGTIYLPGAQYTRSTPIEDFTQVQDDFRRMGNEVAHAAGHTRLFSGEKRGFIGVHYSPITSGASLQQHGFGKRANLSQDLLGGIRNLYGDEVASMVLNRATTIEGVEQSQLFKMSKGMDVGAGGMGKVVRFDLREANILGIDNIKKALESRDTYGEMMNLIRARSAEGLITPSAVPDTFAINLGKGMDLVLPQSIHGDTSYLGHFGTGDKFLPKRATRVLKDTLTMLSGKTSLSEVEQRAAKESFKSIGNYLADSVARFKPSLSHSVNSRLITMDAAIKELFGKQGILREEFVETVGKGITDPEELVGLMRADDFKDLSPSLLKTSGRASGLHMTQAGLIRHPSPDISKAAGIYLVDVEAALDLAMDKAINTGDQKTFGRIGVLRDAAFSTHLSGRGTIGISKLLAKFQGGDKDADLLQIAALTKKEQDAAKDVVLRNGDAFVDNMKKYVSLSEWKSSQAMRPFTEMYKSSVGRKELAGQIRGLTARQQGVIGKTFNTMKPMFEYLNTLPGNTTNLQSRALLGNLYEYFTITALKRENTGELFEAAEEFVEVFQGKKGGKRLTESFEKMLSASEFGPSYSDYKAGKRGVRERAVGEAAENLISNIFGQEVLPDSLMRQLEVKEALTSRAAGSAYRSNALITEAMLGLAEDTTAGFITARTMNVPERALLKQVESTTQGINRIINNLGEMVSSSKGGKKILLYGGATALATTLLFGGDDRLDLKEEEIQAARDELRRQGLNDMPAPSVDFRETNSGRISIGGMRVRASGGIAGIGGARDSLTAFKANLNGTNSSIRVHDDRMDMTARRVQRMADSGRSYY